VTHIQWYDDLLERVFPIDQCDVKELERDYLKPVTPMRSWGPHNHGWCATIPEQHIYVPGGFYV
jgi:hypothetical protein